LTGDEQQQFQVSLLTGLCWLAVAGIAHRGIAPSTVRWDGQRAQITDFSMCSVIGALREPIGSQPWAAREQRQGDTYGRVSVRDDIWAAGRLIFHLHTQEELTDRSQLEERPALKNLLEGVFGPPEGRPTARELLTRLSEECPVPHSLDNHPGLERGRRRFYAIRSAKHPGVANSADIDGDSTSESEGAARQPHSQPGTPTESLQIPLAGQ
jgi:serine/threonine protein kinase